MLHVNPLITNLVKMLPTGPGRRRGLDMMGSEGYTENKNSLCSKSANLDEIIKYKSDFLAIQENYYIFLK